MLSAPMSANAPPTSPAINGVCVLEFNSTAKNLQNFRRSASPFPIAYHISDLKVYHIFSSIFAHQDVTGTDNAQAVSEAKPAVFRAEERKQRVRRIVSSQ